MHIDAYGNVNEVKFELNGVDYLLSKMLSRIEDLEVNLSDARTEIIELKATLKKPTVGSKDMSTQTEQCCRRLERRAPESDLDIKSEPNSEKGQMSGGEVLDTTLRPYFYQPQTMSVCDQSNVSYIDVTPNLSDIEIFRRSDNARSDDYGTLKWTNSPLFKK